LLTFAYGPQREVSYRIILSVLGLTNSPQFSAGSYTLIGSLGLTSYVTEAHVLGIVGGVILVQAFVYRRRRLFDVTALLRYTCFLTLAILLLLNLPSQWIWLLPMGLLYASISGNDRLGAYILPFGTGCCFALVTLVGSGYYLFGGGAQPILSIIE